ncbi:MAG TPA: hypothetical protein VGK81_11150 [Anaerolineae bacterium]|jgi:hypothetical protein
MERFIQGMLALDRRWIYLTLAVTLLVALWFGKPLNPVVLPSVQQLYDAVEEAPAGPGQGKIVLVGMTFSAGTMGENANQARAVLRHLMLRHKRFAIISISEPQGAKFGKMMTTDIAKQYGYRYGIDWISFDYQLGTVALYKSLIYNIPNAIGVDGIEKKPIASFPIMQGIYNANDIALHIEITASSSVWDWIQIVQPATNPRLKIGYGCTGIMATEAYPLLDSGQLVGMLPGLKGAADYEKLVDDLQTQEFQGGRVKAAAYDYAAPAVLTLPASARQLMFTQGAAHMVIILFIFIGNLGLLLSWLQKRSARKEKANG